MVRNVLVVKIGEVLEKNFNHDNNRSEMCTSFYSASPIRRTNSRASISLSLGMSCKW